jgi:hypothetical protein
MCVGDGLQPVASASAGLKAGRYVDVKYARYVDVKYAIALAKAQGRLVSGLRHKVAPSQE